MSQPTVPYGAWPSPITATMLTTATPAMRDVGVWNESICWVESRPQERGRHVLVMRTDDGAADVTPAPYSVRSRVHEYGGGAWTATGDGVVFSNFEDNRLYRIDGPGGTPEPITPEGPWRYADLQFDAASGRLIAVREDHSNLNHEPLNTLVVLALDGSNDEGGRVIASGTDFVSSPRLSHDGRRLSWLTWNHPAMPWDETELWIGEFEADGSLVKTRTVAGGPGESVILQNWDRNGQLVYVSDRTGWWNLYRTDGETVTALTTAETEYGVPLWNFGMSTWAQLADGTIAAAYTSNGNWFLSTISPNGDVKQLDEVFTSISDVHVTPGGNTIYCKVGTGIEQPRLVEIDPRTGSQAPLVEPESLNLDPGLVSVAQPISWPTPDGTVAYGFFYAPTNSDVEAPDGTLPPLVVISHGGPTSATSATFSLAAQFWTSRGFAILDVNYGGSTGYGRAYRERLLGTWGVVDVDDCASGAEYLASQGLVDPERLIIRGGSAGGFTTLAALAFRDTFAAGVSYYGIGDLEAMVRDTHKFEARYLDGLVGPYPDAIETYHARSAIHHVDQLSSPMILLQGFDDKVVPPNQATLMADAVRERGLPVSLVTYAGEGHGFRMAETIEHSVLAELSFLGQVFGFEPAGDVPKLTIDNLPR
jgi:dipeptidyl aminopeptidase/acylaminoacyl peptidase